MIYFSNRILSSHPSSLMITSVKQQSPWEVLHIPLKAVRNKGHLLVTGRSKDYLTSSRYWESFCGTESPRSSDWWTNQTWFYSPWGKVFLSTSALAIHCSILKQTLAVYFSERVSWKPHKVAIFLNGHIGFINIYFPNCCILKFMSSKKLQEFFWSSYWPFYQRLQH